MHTFQINYDITSYEWDTNFKLDTSKLEDAKNTIKITNFDLLPVLIGPS